MKTYLAFDIGGTKLKYALINNQGQLLKEYSEPTIQDSKELFLKRFKEIVDKFKKQISGVGISVPGKINRRDQSISFGGSLPFLDGVSFSEILGDMPVSVENDAKAATLAELWQGTLKETNNAVMLVLGTAIGSGIVLNRELIYGSHEQAGEVSFMSYGKFGKDELMGGKCSAVGLIQNIAKHYGLSDINDGPAVFELIKEHDEYAWQQFEIFCNDIALMIHNMQTVLDVDSYVIGGGISRQNIVATEINSAFEKLRATNTFVDKTLTKPQIVGSTFHNEANLLGSIYKFEKNTIASKQLGTIGEVSI
ncbi:ROK family protein [Companilactobacillus kimchiensis]|uniref:Sugar kinase and transcription regulator n=1 Tax=Companilactobacillus kimchiensis TaxID=993692 RepID=A0A0R2LNQ6_9LACO|nr:ROK family protein [Companilactobacillus kimchiensis]KRN99956.1 sugar kinase and transcription regulator [Companilactobacillus kimchiensis]